MKKYAFEIAFFVMVFGIITAWELQQTLPV